MSMYFRRSLDVREVAEEIARDIDENGRFRPKLRCGPTRTKQADKDRCDINKIVAKYNRTGMLEHVNKNAPFFGDVAQLGDYQEAMNVVVRANELFAGMSSSVRERFHNDPNEMIEFLSKEENKAEAIKLGMVNAPKVPPPEVIQKVQIVDPDGGMRDLEEPPTKRSRARKGGSEE